MGSGCYLINPHWLPVSCWKGKNLVQFTNVESETKRLQEEPKVMKIVKGAVNRKIQVL